MRSLSAAGISKECVCAAFEMRGVIVVAMLGESTVGSGVWQLTHNVNNRAFKASNTRVRI